MTAPFSSPAEAENTGSVRVQEVRSTPARGVWKKLTRVRAHRSRVRPFTRQPDSETGYEELVIAPASPKETTNDRREDL